MRAAAFVFTFKEGLFARLAHDLRLTVQSFEITVQSGAVRAWFDASSLSVDGVAHGERVDPDGLSPEDKRKILDTIARDVLQSATHPRIELDGKLVQTGQQTIMDGKLRLHGVERPVRIPVDASAQQLSAEFAFSPASFGIRPYKALGGVIRLQDRVVVRVVADYDNLAALSANDALTSFRPA